MAVLCLIQTVSYAKIAYTAYTEDTAMSSSQFTTRASITKVHNLFDRAKRRLSGHYNRPES